MWGYGHNVYRNAKYRLSVNTRIYVRQKGFYSKRLCVGFHIATVYRSVVYFWAVCVQLVVMFTNSVYPDETAHYESPYQGLHYFFSENGLKGLNALDK